MITSYSTLQAEIKSVLWDRDDVDDEIKTAIQLFERKAIRDPRFRKLQLRATFNVTADDTDTLPSDFQSMESWYVDDGTNRGRVTLVSAERLAALKQTLGTSGLPRFAANIDGTLRYAPAPDTTYPTKMTYWRVLAPLSDSETTNWLLTDHPDIYLYGSLLEMEATLRDDERLPIWEGKYEKAVTELDEYTRRYALANGVGVEASPRVDGTETLTTTTLAGFKRVLANWLNRSDLSDGVLDVIIDLAEARLKRDRRLQRTKVITAVIPASGELILPTDFDSVEDWSHNGPTYYGPLDVIDPGELEWKKITEVGTSGPPVYASIVDKEVNGVMRSAVTFAPAPDGVYKTRLVHRASIANLTSSSTNWLFDDHFDVYLYAALVEAVNYLLRERMIHQSDPLATELLPEWKAEREARIEEVYTENQDRRWSGVRRRTFTPIGG